MYHDGNRELQARFESTALADRLLEKTHRTAFNESDKAFIESLLPGKAQLFPNADEWINAGDSVVASPGGKIVAGPLHDAYGFLYADIDVERVGIARRSLDAAGHYARPDIFQLSVNRRPSKPIEIQEGPVPLNDWDA